MENKKMLNLVTESETGLFYNFKQLSLLNTSRSNKNYLFSFILRWERPHLKNVLSYIKISIICRLKLSFWN